MQTMRNFLGGGFELGWWGLFFLAGAIPFMPFSTLGYAGMNLLVGGSPAGAAGKFALHGFTTLANTYLKTYYPSLWLYAFATLVSPWYVYDLVQMFSPEFEKEGFKIPFTNKHLAAAGGKGKLTLLNAPVILGVLALGSYSLLQYIDPRVLKGAKPALEMLSIIIGSLSALAAGGASAMLAFPGILTSLQAGSASLKEALKEDTGAGASGAAASGAQPAASGAAGGAPAAAAPLSGPSVQRGGATGNPGSSIPALRDIAHGMLGPSPTGDPTPYRSGILSGGAGSGNGPSETSSALFLGTLVVAALAGISIALARSKASTPV